MYHPPLPLSATCYGSALGDVSLQEGVVLAPGVLVCADPGSRVLVEAGTCFGMGCVIHAQGGLLHFRRGVNLGAGVLVVGYGVIGANSCIGAAASLLNPQVAEGAVVAPYSILIAPEEPVDDDQPAATVESPARVFARSQLQTLKGQMFPVHP
ncbi:MAG: hypothetical protein HC919_14155 [Oscillatoriales cyanobacterium SM2_2_1]|nr:hypothetical protein [Oscillatoriales cyanobacterium SM2_2_1]